MEPFLFLFEKLLLRLSQDLNIGAIFGQLSDGFPIQ